MAALEPICKTVAQLSGDMHLGRGLLTTLCKPALVVCIVLLTTPGPALAAPRNQSSPAAIAHRTKPGDTLALLAAEYYGDRRYEILIAAENGLASGQPIPSRKVLRIPVDQQVVTDVGATLEDLAEKYLGSDQRAKFLLGFNDDLSGPLEPDTPLPAGLSIRVPLHVHHRLAPDESLRDVATYYFGNPEKARLVQEYNFLADQDLASGQILLLPVYHVSVHAPRRPVLDAKAHQRLLRRAEMQQRAHGALAGAHMAWSSGDYSAVRDRLNGLDTDYLDTNLAVEVCVLMGSADVAFGDEERAEAMFRKALARKPAHLLDVYAVSPKIRAVWERVGGAVDGT